MWATLFLALVYSDYSMVVGSLRCLFIVVHAVFLSVSQFHGLVSL